jgi:hypothetical protein
MKLVGLSGQKECMKEKISEFETNSKKSYQLRKR